MSTDITKYTFLPWVKTGLGASILNNEKELKEPRAKIQVDLSVRRYNEQNIPSVEPISKNFFLYGPGDIKGIQNSVIIRTEPNANILNFEPNYFPFIEFSQSDFPWRYTPAKPRGDQPSGRLSPWLALIVLEENEFDGSPHTSEPGALPKIHIKRPEKSLPDLKQCWGWAHTQVMQEITEPDSLRKILASEPYKVISRILCLRRLKPDTHYFAFVVPTFELGRRAGLGIVDENNMAGTSFAWSVDGSLQDHPLPIYYRWEFSTSLSGDFESLARKLENRQLPREVGIKKLDVSEALLSVGSEIGFKKPLFLGGALWSEEAKKFVTGKKIDLDEYRIVDRDEEDPSDEEIKGFIMKMKEQIDLGERLSWSFARRANFSNECKDPVISPPMYGKWHARKRLVSRISDDFNDPSWIKSLGLDPSDFDFWLGEFKNDPPYEWLEQLNLDPTNRVAAGLGTAVVNKLQEELMESAWDQAGQILESNKHLRLSELSREVSSNIYHRCFQPLERNVSITMLSKFHSRVYLKFKDDNGDDKLVSVKKLLKDSRIPDAIFSPTFTKINTRYTKIQSKRFGLKYNNSFNILDRLNKKGSGDTDISNAALGALKPGSLLTLDYLVHIPIHDVLNLPIKEDDFRGDKLTEYRNHGQDPPEIREMVKGIENSIPDADAGATVDGLEGVEVDVGLDTINEHLKHSLNPQITIETKILEEVKRPKRLLEETKDKLDSVIAYPEFNRPMFEPLRDTSEELLLPGVKYISPNTIGIVQTNPTFINSYMVGLNHEMARELLWREYPTDQRGSYFRQFWDASAAVERERTSGKDEEVIIEKYRDIPEIHSWKHSPIENIKGIAESENGVLLIRGELLMRYPGTVIYAIKADSGLANNNNNKPILPDTDKDIKEPLFRGTVPPDITFLGFDIKLRDLLRSDEAPHGYFFIIQQQPSEPRFGIDERDPKDPLVDLTILKSWNDLNWDHVILSVGSNNYIDLEAVPLNGLEIEKVTWGTHAADLAYILLQHPVRIAVHARDLLPNLISH